jgi:hypothetical protein
VSLPIPYDYPSYDHLRVAKIVATSAAVGMVASAAIAGIAGVISLTVNRHRELDKLKEENERLKDAAGKLAVDAG